VTAAAAVLGITERAVRKRIAAGTLTGIRDGRRWLVDLPAELVPEPEGEPIGSAKFRVPVHSGTTQEPLGPLVEELATLRRRNEELAGQVGFWQGRYHEASEQLKLLQAPEARPTGPTVAAAGAPHKRPWWHFWR
jgi:hypothetical protein